MKRFITFALAVLLAAPAATSAHGPSRQRVVRELQINAPPAEVWELIRDFCSISNWNPEVPECSAEPGDIPDTVRTITLANGQSLQEKLVKHRPEDMSMQYMLIEANPEALPINTLGSTLAVRAGDDGGSVVEWKTAFYRSFPGPTPPPELSDEAAIAAVSRIVEAGLAGLKELAEK
jgi:hypothetical protein